MTKKQILAVIQESVDRAEDYKYNVAANKRKKRTTATRRKLIMYYQGRIDAGNYLLGKLRK